MINNDQNRDILFEQKSFLELTRRNEIAVARPFEKTLADGGRVTLIDTGILRVEPAQAGDKSIVISSGVHGDETAPIEIVDSVIHSILSGELKVRNRTLFIIGNPVAMNKGRRFETENLNRLFNGGHKKLDHYEAQRARILEDAVRDFFGRGDDSGLQLHYDLHTAIRGSKYKKFAVYPYPDERPWSKDQLQFFLASGVNTVLLSHRPAGTFSYFSSHEFKAHAFTVELGQVKPFGQNDMREFDAITRNLTALITGADIAQKPYKDEDFNLFRVKAEIIKRSDAFKLHIADDVENFTDFKKGFQLAEDIDGGYVIEDDGDAIVFPNARVPIGQRAGLILGRTHLDAAASSSRRPV